MRALEHALCENHLDRTGGRDASVDLLEVLHGLVDVPARLLEGARADHLVLTRGAVDLLARLLHRSLVARDCADHHEEAQRLPPLEGVVSLSISLRERTPDVEPPIAAGSLGRFRRGHRCGTRSERLRSPAHDTKTIPAGDAPPCHHPRLGFSWCRGGANRVLPGAERVADLLLRVLQDLLGAPEGIPAAVEHLPRAVRDRLETLRGLRTHSARLVPRIVFDLPPPEPDGGGTRDRSQNERLIGSHGSPPRVRVMRFNSGRVSLSARSSPWSSSSPGQRVGLRPTGSSSPLSTLGWSLYHLAGFIFRSVRSGPGPEGSREPGLAPRSGRTPNCYYAARSGAPRPRTAPTR